jgi:hypothetical protein
VAIRVKAGVDFSTVAPAGFCILSALKATSRDLGVDLTITSACDGEHSGPTDPHRLGEAYDVRSHDLLPELRPRVLGAVMQRLGRERFYGFLEAPGTSNEHFHFQRRRGTTFTIADYLGDMTL